MLQCPADLVYIAVDATNDLGMPQTGDKKFAPLKEAEAELTLKPYSSVPYEPIYIKRSILDSDIVRCFQKIIFFGPGNVLGSSFHEY